MGKVIGIVLLLLAALLLAALNFFFNFAHRRRRPKRQKKPAPPANEAERQFQEMVAEGRAWVEGQPGEQVSVTSFDGLRLRGLYFPADRPRACVLLFHGYRSTGLRDFGLLIPYYHNTGFSVLAVDQRACGESEGRRLATARAVSCARSRGECHTASSGTPEMRSASSSA